MRMVEHNTERVDFSVALLEALRKRAKALSRRGATIECSPVKEIVDGQESKLDRTDLTIRYRVAGDDVQLRVHAWGDRWIWVDARRASKAGWVWEYTSEGRFVSPGEARGLVELIEQTMDCSNLAASDPLRAVAAIWSKCLAIDPHRVRRNNKEKAPISLSAPQGRGLLTRKAEHNSERADFSVALLEAFRKRSRALSRLPATVECIPVREIVDGQESELGRTDLTIKYRAKGTRVQLRVHAWGDRWIWVDARRGSKVGWVWEYTNEGRFISPSGAPGLVQLIEQTMDCAYLATSDVSRAMAAIWSKCLAVGPRPVWIHDAGDEN
jgi:hypothetical protein